jgi:hypothetical protein
MTLHRALHANSTCRRVVRIIGNCDRCTPAYDWHLAFKIPHVYDNITKLSINQAEVRQKNLNSNIHATGQGIVFFCCILLHCSTSSCNHRLRDAVATEDS